MTEAEWLACADPLPMLINLRGEVTEAERLNPLSPYIISGYGNLYSGPSDQIAPRKIRLFIVACLQRLRSIPLDALDLNALNAYTRYATGRGSREDFRRACLAIQERLAERVTTVISHLAEAMWPDDAKGAASASGEVAWQIAHYVARESVARTCAHATEDDWFSWGFCGGPPDALWQETRASESKYQASLLRHIVGNPFRPVQVEPRWFSWNGGTVLKLARAIDEHWACHRLPVLADALEEAGCAEAAILDHCRGPGPHVRGCWVLDLLLGKT